MARQVSCTCTVGEGSEQHNHDLDYRQSLEHVHGSSDDVIELVPYTSYQEQINEMMKPYIDAYNEAVEARYEAAKQRFKDGKIKSRPKRKDYQLMDYDYFSEHLHDTRKNPVTGKVEEIPMFRSIIIGLGDKADRESGIITQEEAVAVMTKLVKNWPELFPDFKLLGATIHLDESGFYHCHIDYKPMYSKEALNEIQLQELDSLDGLEAAKGKKSRGLMVGIGHEAALQRMGYEPEQSIINQSDKVPIRFNAFRNQIYRETEKNLNAHGLRLMYKATEKKDPGKDSSVNQRLENWQATQDAMRDMQQQKNLILDALEQDGVTPQGTAEIMAAAMEITKKMNEIENSPKSRLDKSKRVVEFRLFDQLKSFVQDMINTVHKVLHQVDDLKKENRQLKSQIREKDCEIIELRRSNSQLTTENLELKKKVQEQAAELAKYKEMQQECPGAWEALQKEFEKVKCAKFNKQIKTIEMMEEVWTNKSHPYRRLTRNGYTRFNIPGVGQDMNAMQFMTAYMQRCNKAKVPANSKMEYWYDQQRAREYER